MSGREIDGLTMGSTWEPRRLDELGFVGRGKSRHRPRNDAKLYGGQYPFIQTADVMAADPYITSYSQTYSEFGLQQSKMWPPGTLCMTIAGANTAKTAILKFATCFPDSIVGFIPDKSKADLHFVKYSLDLMRNRFLSVSRGATQDNLSLDKLLSFPIPAPDVNEQRRIGAILSAYDELIENSQRRIQILEAMARTLYREWFVHFRFPGHENSAGEPNWTAAGRPEGVSATDGTNQNLPLVTSPLGDIPQGWEVKPFGELYNTSSGGTPSRKQPQYFEGGSTDWVKSQELLDGFILSSEERITEEALKKSSAKVFPTNTVLIALYGATIGKLGILAGEAATNQACCAVLPKRPAFGREFAFLTLLLNRERIIGLRLGAAQQNISQVLLKNLACVKPPDDLVSQFAKRTAPFFDRIHTLQRQIQNLRRTRDLLLPRLLSGQATLNDLAEGEAV